jgi:mannose-6-phosphate isomerase-like protein (cupin superfamily)
MATAAIKKNFDSPDETRPISQGKVEVVNLGEVSAMRLTLEPGWRWAESVQPLAGTASCQVHHIGYQAAGRLHIRLDDGSELEVGAGDLYNIPPGHDAWVVGEEPVVFIDFRGAETYARPPR